MTVRTPFLLWFGGAALALTLIIVIAAWGSWLTMFVAATLFGGSGAALFFMSATISGNAETLTVSRIGSRKSVCWAEVERIAAGGGNLVFYKKGGSRVTVLSFEFWAGPEKAALVGLLLAKLDEHAIAFSGASLRAMVHVGDR